MTKSITTLKLWKNCLPLVQSYAKYIHTSRLSTQQSESKRVNLNFDYMFDTKNTKNIEDLIKRRKGVGNIRKVLSINEQLSKLQNNSKEYIKLKKELEDEALLIPNEASPHLMNYGEDPYVLEEVNSKPVYDYKPKELHELANKLDLLRTDNLGNLTGHRSYYFKNALAEMEQGLINYTVAHLLKEGFTLISVPDLLYSDIIEACGMATRGKRNQVYHIADSLEDVCLAGTSEMAVGGFLRNRSFDINDLPLKLAAISRCFRAETSRDSQEKGIYRVHCFTKVEMFGVSAASEDHSEIHSESHNLYTQLTQIQKHLYSSLGLHFQILDMPLHELGAPAYTKTDMEAWMPGRAMFGEISSASNCTDYQSRRLNITYTDAQNSKRFAHTVNGTACAVPRTIMAICETHQQKDGTITIPEALQTYMNGRTTIEYPKGPNNMSWIKHKMYPGSIL